MTEHSHSHESCIRLFEKLSEYIDGELEGASYEQIRQHAEACLKCNNCIETLRKTIDLCSKMKKESLPEGFSERLQNIIQLHLTT